jgi:hypothetical protein
LAKQLQFSRRTFLREEDNSALSEMRRLMTKLISKERMSMQILEDGKHKTQLVKRITVMLKSLSATFRKFNDSKQRIASQRSSDAKALKTLCILPGFQNVSFESFAVCNLTEQQRANLGVGGCVKSSNAIHDFVETVPAKQCTHFRWSFVWQVRRFDPFRLPSEGLFAQF